MSEEQNYIGYGESPPEEEPKRKNKLTFNEIVNDAKKAKHKVKPWVYAFFHFFLAFGTGSIVNYLVSYEYIRPSHVTQIIVSMLVYIYFRLNTHIGDRK